MESKTFSDASDRIGELEREVRALSVYLEASRRHVRRIASLAACSLAVLIFAGAALVKDQRVDVLGPNNDVRVSINVNPVDSGAGINLLDVNGSRRLLIGVNPQGKPEIVFYNPQGQEIHAIRP